MYRFDILVQDKVSEAILKTMPEIHGCYPDIIIVGNSFERRNVGPKEYSVYHAQLESVARDV